MKLHTSFSLVVAMGLVACGGSKKTTVTPAVTAAPEPAAAEAAKAAVEPVKTAAEPVVKGPHVVTTVTEGLAAPESVLFDATNDRYLISNVNGSPLAVDNNGYIAVLKPDATTVEKWIVGGANKVKLNAPKGMAIVDGVLYVSDINVVRKFDLATGAAKGEIKLAGATFANDLSVGVDGMLYVSDSGMKMGKTDFEGTGTDAVWVINTKDKAPKAKKLLADKALHRPNGLLATTEGVWVVPFAASDAYLLGGDGKVATTVAVGAAALDGICQLGGAMLVSSWEKNAVYRSGKGTEGLTFVPFIENVASPADIECDGGRNRVLIPRMMDNKVEVYQAP